MWIKITVNSSLCTCIVYSRFVQQSTSSPQKAQPATTASSSCLSFGSFHDNIDNSKSNKHKTKRLNGPNKRRIDGRLSIKHSRKIWNERLLKIVMFRCSDGLWASHNLYMWPQARYLCYCIVGIFAGARFHAGAQAGTISYK